MFKRGSLNLSINAIVVLILAVTMLGLGLMFMQNMMGGAMDELDSVSGAIEDQMIERIRSSNRRLEFSTHTFRVDRAGSETYYYGILNQLDVDTEFNIEFHCQSAMGDSDPANDITFDFIPSTVYLSQNEIDVQTVIINADPQAENTNYRCGIFIDAAEDSSEELGDSDAVGTQPNNAGADRFNQLQRASGLYQTRTFEVSVQ